MDLWNPSTENQRTTKEMHEELPTSIIRGIGFLGRKKESIDIRNSQNN